MTLLPSAQWDIKGIHASPEYRVGPRCATPACGRLADHAHHLWRRSFLGGDFKYVEVDSLILRNLVGLCWQHHEDVTGGIGGTRAWIEYDHDEHQFWWNERAGNGWQRTGLLEILQPVRAGATPQPPSDGDLPGPAGDAGIDAVCPTCGHRQHRTPKVDLPPGERRPRASWTVKVPDDERERGADVLDVLEAECADAFAIAHYSPVANRRYFTTAQAMAFVLQHEHELREAEEGA